MKCYLIRHGEIEANINKVYAGWSEEGLTARGIRQANATARELIDYGIDLIFCSPLFRTVQTAGIIGELLKKEPIPEESFKELKMGPWEGLSEESIAEKYPEQWRLWNSQPADLMIRGRETLSDVAARALAGLAKIRAEHFGKTVLIVSHVAVIRVLLLFSRGMDLTFYKTISVDNGQVFEIPDESFDA